MTDPGAGKRNIQACCTSFRHTRNPTAAVGADIKVAAADLPAEVARVAEVTVRARVAAADIVHDRAEVAAGTAMPSPPQV